MQIEYVKPADESYRAGACNISGQEIARRRTFGVAAVGGAVALGAVLVAVDAPTLMRGIVVLPLIAGLVSLEEARRHFCGAFAFLGIRSVTGSDATQRVADPRDQAADRAAARWMVAYCGAIAVAIAVVFMLLPI